MKLDMIENYENEEGNRNDKDQVAPVDDIHNDKDDDDNMELFEDSNFNDSFNSINVDMNKNNYKTNDHYQCDDDDDNDDVKDNKRVGDTYNDDYIKVDYENANIQHVSSSNNNNNINNENNITIDMMNVDSKIKINNDTSININNKNNDYNFLKAQFKNKQLEHDFIENGELTEEMLEFLWDTAFNNNHSISTTFNSSNHENNDNDDDNNNNHENGWYKKVLPPRKYPESKYHLDSLKLKTTIKISTVNLKSAATNSTTASTSAAADNNKRRNISKNHDCDNIDDYKNMSNSGSSSSIENCDKNSNSIDDSNKLSSLNYDNYYDYKNDTIINENNDGDNYYYKSFVDDDDDDGGGGGGNKIEFTDNTIKNSQQALILNNPEYIFDVSPPIVIDRIRNVEVLSLPKINNCYGSKNNNNNNKEKKQYNEDDNYNETIIKIKSDSLLNKNAKRAKQQEIREFLTKDKNKKY
jgi:hypothetical protein